MTIEHHSLLRDFPEHHDRIKELQASDHHFKRLYEEYHGLDDRIYRSEIQQEVLSHEHLEDLKKQRALLKDKLFAQLQEPA
jgi:uncharacterized protein YdcH (DUF465 family)